MRTLAATVLNSGTNEMGFECSTSTHRHRPVTIDGLEIFAVEMLSPVG